MDQSDPASLSSLLILSLLMLQLQGAQNQQVHLEEAVLFLLQHCQVNHPLAWWTDSIRFYTRTNTRADTGESFGGQSQGYEQGE